MKCWALALALCGCTSPKDPPPAPRDAEVSVAAPVLDSGAGDELDAAVESELDAQAPTGTAAFGPEHRYEGTLCSYLLTGNFRVAERDLRTSFVDGDDPLALVNRSPTGALAPNYAPSDLISFAPRKPRAAKECDSLQCLRKDAMAGYDVLVAAMKAAGFQASLQSAYRSYKAQCGTFGHWAGTSSACKATQQSALPGHSQHQLGTVVDLFTESWRMSGPSVFRHGFGCNKAGEFLREQAWKYGWVISYPIHPDDRLPKQPCEARFDVPVSINAATGYGHEAWHIRFLGVDNATAYHQAASIDETLTLEQWLRGKRGLPAAVATELPVCDGCNCGACASLDPEASACKDGLPVPVPGLDGGSDASVPKLVHASWVREGDHVRLEVRIRVDGATSTQPPVFRNGKLGYVSGESYLHVVGVRDGGARAFPDAPGAYRLAARASSSDEWPYRVALPTAPSTSVYDRANVVLPAARGEATLVLTVPEAIVEVALLRDGKPVARLSASEAQSQ